MTAPTPGRRAYEAWRGEDTASALAPPWAALGDGDRERWERAGWINDESGLRAELERAQEEAGDCRDLADCFRDERDRHAATLAKVRAIAFKSGMSHMLKLRALLELLDPALRPAEASPDDLRAALSSLTDRAEASQAITGDEAAGYRKLTANGGAR